VPIAGLKVRDLIDVAGEPIRRSVAGLREILARDVERPLAANLAARGRASSAGSIPPHRI
jgi:hypothetical protein